MITKTQTNKVEVAYQVEQDGLSYQDTLVFTEDEFKNVTEEDIDKAITDKFISWKGYIETPTPEPTKEDKEAELEQLEKQIADAEAKKAKLEDEIKDL